MFVAIRRASSTRGSRVMRRRSCGCAQDADAILTALLGCIPRGSDHGDRGDRTRARHAPLEDREMSICSTKTRTAALSMRTRWRPRALVRQQAHCAIAPRASSPHPLGSGNTSLRRMERWVFLVPVAVRGNSLKTSKRTHSNDGNSRAICSSSELGGLTAD